MGETHRRLVHDSQLRWLGPEKGVMHMAIGAVVNAAVGPRGQAGRAAAVAVASAHVAGGARRPGRLPLPQRCPHAGRGAGHPAQRPNRAADGRSKLNAEGYPAYTTTPGWLGYSDEKMARLRQEAVADGFTQIKLKVGADLADDVRRLGWPARPSAPTITDRRSTPTSAGTCRRRSSGCRAAAVRSVLDRGADQPRRHARPRRDPRGVARSRSRPVSTSRTG